jgi:hypothetical protein
VKLKSCQRSVRAFSTVCEKKHVGVQERVDISCLTEDCVEYLRKRTDLCVCVDDHVRRQGLELLTNDPSVTQIYIQTAPMQVPSLAETDEINGTSHLLEHMPSKP